MIKNTIIGLALSGMLAGMAMGAGANLAECSRPTAQFGGEDLHQDLGEGRVMWRIWWSHEGTASTYVVFDCAEGQALQFLTQEQGMSDRTPFDRTKAALKIVQSHERGARAFATLPRIAEDLEGTARDVVISPQSVEPCACAAAYAELRGDKTAFVPEG